MGAFLWTLLIGLVVGAIAKLLMPGKDPGGCIITILLGIAGALVAGYLGRVRRITRAAQRSSPRSAQVRPGPAEDD